MARISRGVAHGASRGFSLVELLAVVLILAVLAGVAVPLYLNSRKQAAARVCKANLAEIAAAQSVYSTRFGKYCLDGAGALATETTYNPTGPAGGLIGAPEGLAQEIMCPLGGKSYTCTAVAGGGVEVQCLDAAQHNTDTGFGGTAPWDLTLQPLGADKTNPL